MLGKSFWHTILHHFGVRRAGRARTLVSRASLRQFINSRAGHVAQTSLYGQLRTRAGIHYVGLFEDDAFIEALNIGRWQLWLACISDLSVYTGVLLTRARVPGPEVNLILGGIVAEILQQTGVPADSGPQFESSVQALSARIEVSDWQVIDAESAFNTSADALLRWAPEVENIKQLDTRMVRNSIDSRWNAVRRQLREQLDVPALLRAQEQGN